MCSIVIHAVTLYVCAKAELTVIARAVVGKVNFLLIISICGNRWDDRVRLER